MDYSTIAIKIIKGIIKLIPGQTVSISAEILNVFDFNEALVKIPFLEELAIQVRKHHGIPIIDLSTENLHKRFFEEVTDENNLLSLAIFHKWLDSADYFIDLSWRSNPLFYKSIPEIAFRKVNIPTDIYMQKIAEKNKKLLLLGYPTKSLAKYLDVDQEVLKKTYLSSLNVDYHLLKKNCLIFDGIIKKQKKYHLICENRVLNIELVSKSKCFYGDFYQEPILYLPTGYWQQEVDLEQLSGMIYANQIYFDQHYWKNVQLVFKNGSIIDLETDNQQKNTTLLRVELAQKINSCLLVVGLNDSVGQRSFYSLFDLIKSQNVSLILNTSKGNIVVLSETASLLNENDVNLLNN